MKDPLSTAEAAAALGGQPIPQPAAPAPRVPREAAAKPASVAGEPPAPAGPVPKNISTGRPAPRQPAPFATGADAPRPQVLRAGVDRARAAAAALHQAVAQHAAALAAIGESVDMPTLDLARLEGFDLPAAIDYGKAILAAHTKALQPKD